jgi:hypothetical protein
VLEIQAGLALGVDECATEELTTERIEDTERGKFLNRSDSFFLFSVSSVFSVVNFA